MAKRVKIACSAHERPEIWHEARESLSLQPSPSFVLNILKLGLQTLLKNYEGIQRTKNIITSDTHSGQVAIVVNRESTIRLILGSFSTLG